ncbi:MAG: hypothetical protein K9N52_00815 [Verrucomicrobia bacterium]|nr:hypothetical protein [Verrucomicrobiota bacterium]
MSQIDVHYRHYDGGYRGIWMRRCTIASAGLRSCLGNRWMRYLIALSWSGALAMVGVIFLLGQLLIEDSIVFTWLEELGPQLQNFAGALVTWLIEHPEISVRTTYNLLFYFFSTMISGLSFIAVAMVIPHLITRDLSSNAIVIYASKAVGRLDYLLGKLGTVLVVLCLTWFLPLIAAWFFGNLLAPDWGFFWHSRTALLKVFLYVGGSILFLGLVSLGVSAVSSKEKTCVGLWLFIWLFGNALVPLSMATKPWLKFFSFSYNLDQVALSVFRLNSELELAQANVPVLGRMLRGISSRTEEAWANPEIQGALIGLSIMILISAWIVWIKVKPE